MRFYIRIQLDDEMYATQWSTEVYDQDGRKFRTLVHSFGPREATPQVALEEAMQDVHSLYKTPPLWTER